jgi:hypothetical protein
MQYREEIIRNYITAYNQFDIKKMITDLDASIIFENIQNGICNMRLTGIEEFRKQAELSKTYFLSRQQTISSIIHFPAETEVEIAYSAILAIDIPNGLKRGDELCLKGKSIFKFQDGKITHLTDIS